MASGLDTMKQLCASYVRLQEELEEARMALSGAQAHLNDVQVREKAVEDELIKAHTELVGRGRGIYSIAANKALVVSPISGYSNNWVIDIEDLVPLLP